MKVRKKLLILGMLLAVFICMGCSEQKGVGQKSVKEIRVGIFLYNQDDMFIKDMMEKLDSGFREKEKEGDFKLTFNFCDAKSSQTVQNDQIDKYIAQKYDVLCVNLVDRTDASVIIDMAKKAEIPVLFFNREPVSADMERWEQTYYVGVATEDGGKFQGDIFLEQYEKNPEIDKNGDGIIQYVMLEGEPGHQDTMIRTESCIKTIQAAGIELERLETYSANWRRSQSKEIMEDWIEKYGDAIEVVFSNNDEMALGAVDAVAAKGLLDGSIKIIGLDGLSEAREAVRSGQMLGTVLNDVDGQVSAIIDLTVALGMGETPKDIPYMQDDRTVRVPHRIVR